jgi:periplasmic protein TonB
MTGGAAAAPRYRRQAGVATAVVVVFGGLGSAASQAMAGEVLVPQVGTETTSPTTVSSTAAAPAPDPQPGPRPDPKPSRPKQRTRVTPPSPSPPPPPPPPPPSPAPSSATPPSTVETTAAAGRPAPPSSNRRRDAHRSTTEVAAVVTQVRRRPGTDAAQKVRRERRALRRRTTAARKPSRSPSTVPPGPRAFELASAPTPVLPQTEAPASTALALVLPLLGLGALLLGASAVSPRHVPWPGLAAPLHAHRVDLATLGVGAIALALLWLNVTVFF